jgi:membrane protease YdiL (CAAX protease family)
MFIEKAYSGKNQVWRFLITIVIVFIATEIIGALPLLLVILNSMAKSGTYAIPENPADFAAMGVDPNFGLLLMLLPFAIGLIFLLLAIRKIHYRPMITVLTSRSSFSWRRFLFGAGIWTIFMLVSLIIHIVAEPANYVFQPNWNAFIPLFFIAVIFIPFQAGFEEVLFRGYLMQAFGLLFKYRWAAILITGLGFGLLHSFNPEVKAYGFWLTMPEYVGLGLFFGVIALLDEGLEMVIGIHVLNNIFLSLFVTNESSALQTSALIHIRNINSYTDMAELYIFMFLFIVLAQRRYKWRDWKSIIFGRISKSQAVIEQILEDA